MMSDDRLHQVAAAIDAGGLGAALDLLIAAGRDPDTNLVRYLTLRAGWHMRQHQWEPALAILAEAEKVAPFDYTVHYNVGYCHHKLGNLEQAAEHYEATLRLKPDVTAAWVRRGHIALLMERPALGLACYQYAAALSPNDAEARAGYGTALSFFGDDESAEREYRRALEIDPASDGFEAAFAITLLRSGQWEEGFRRRQAVTRTIPFGAPWNYKPDPVWCGKPEELRGRDVLLLSEQGYGDTIHFMRYVPMVAEIAASVAVLTQKPLMRLCQGDAWSVGETKMAADPSPKVIQTTLMSLPAVFGTTPENCPSPARYRATPRSLGARLGICWHGDARPNDPLANADDRRRSIAWETFAPLADVVPCLSLQFEDLQRFGCKDWQDTADVVAALDLVITVDTAVAHLAASLGVETWMLSRFSGCWRWLSSGDRTCWYPSMRIYRQPTFSAWQPVVDRVLVDLKDWAKL
jgi:hypothetical protein